MDEKDVMRRAMAAHFRGGGTDQPSGSESEMVEVGGKWYAVLVAANMLKVYRYRNDDSLKLLKRIPKEIEERYGQ